MDLSWSLSIHPFLSLPTELKTEILSYCSDVDLIHLFLICKSFLVLNNEEAIWRARTIQALANEQATHFFQIFNSYKAAYVHIKQIHREGKVEKGEYKEGLLNGIGMIIYRDGTVKKGLFTHGKLNGLGIIEYADGEREEGYYIDDLLDGEAKRTYPDNEKIEEGQFQKDKLNGLGKMTYPHKVLEGEFKEGRLNGKGTITYVDDEVQREEGTFMDNMLHGEGKRIYANGKVEAGQFLYHVFQG